MLRALESYRFLSDAVGPTRARQLSWAELVSRGAQRVARSGWSAVLPPSVDSLVGSMPHSVTSAIEVLQWAGISAERSEDLVTEFQGVASKLEDAYRTNNLSCPTNFAVEESTSAILYSLVRETRPERVIETGIANGHSSFVILAAMAANGAGQLSSVDIMSNVGGLVPARLASRWDKVIISGQRPGLDTLRARLSPGGPVDIFFHDGDHRYLGQMLDYRIGVELLKPGGILISDDINTTSAWVDARHMGIVGGDGLVLLDRRKAIGFCRV